MAPYYEVPLRVHTYSLFGLFSVKKRKGRERNGRERNRRERKIREVYTISDAWFKFSLSSQVPPILGEEENETFEKRFLLPLHSISYNL